MPGRRELVRLWFHEDRFPVIKRRQVVEIAVQLLGFLSALAMRVVLDAEYQAVDCNKNSENTGQGRLGGDQNDTSNGLRGLRNAQFFNEHQDTHDRKNPDNLDKNVDPVTGFECVGSAPQQENKHDSFNDKVIATEARNKSFELWIDIYGEFNLVDYVERKNKPALWLTRYLDLPGRPTN